MTKTLTRRDVLVALLVTLFSLPALACELAPTPTPTVPSPPTETPRPEEPTGTPTPPPTATPTPFPTPTPAAGPIDLGVPAGDAYGPQDMAVDDSRKLAYVVSGYGDAAKSEGESVLSVVDVTTGQVKESVALPHPFHVTTTMALAPAGDRLFIAGGDDNVLLVVATGTGDEPLGELLSAQSDIRAATLDPTSLRLYVIGLEQIHIFDAKTLEELHTARIPPGLPDPPAQLIIAVSPRASRLYVGSQVSDIITVLRTEDLQEVADILPGGQPMDIVVDPDRPQVYLMMHSPTDGVDRVAVLENSRVTRVWQPQEGFNVQHVVPDDVPDRVYLLERGSEREAQLRAVDPASGQTVGTVVLPTQSATEARVGAGRLHLLTWDNLFITLSVESGDVEDTARLGMLLRDAVVDPDAGRLFVIDSAGTVHVLDAATLQSVDAWARVVGTETETIHTVTLSVANRHLFVPDFSVDETVVLDVATGERVATIPKAGQVTFDPTRNRLFVTRQGVFIVDPETYAVVDSIEDTVRKTLFSGEPSAMAARYDAKYDLLFVTMTNNVAGSSSSTWLLVYDGGTLQRLDTNIKTDQQFLAGLAIDRATDRVYVASSFPRGDLAVFTIRGLLTTRLQHLSGHLFLDQAKDRLYITGWEGVITVDTSTHDVIDYRRLPTGYREFTAFDSTHGRFYTTRSNTADLVIVSPRPSDAVAVQTVGRLPPERIRSLAVADDGTVFVVNDRGSVYRRSSGGWGRVSARLPSIDRPAIHPAPGTSGIVFAHPDQLGQFGQAFGLFRSTDGGRTWQPAARGLRDFAVRDLALSSDFVTDGTGFLLSGGDGIFRSMDGGDTWQRFSDVTGERIALATSDPTTFLVLARNPEAYDETLVYAPTGADTVVQQISTIQAGLFEGDALALSPNYSQDGITIAGLGRAGLFLSQDFGQTWRRLPPRPKAFSVLYAVYFSPDFATDGIVYALLAPSYFGEDDRGMLYRSTDGGETWQWATDADPQMAALAMGPDGGLWMGDAQGNVRPLDPAQLTWKVVREATPTPVPTPSEPPAGFYRPQGVFADLWAKSPEVRRALGWAAEPRPRQASTAFQPFENGMMIWRGDTRTIYALYDDGSWDGFEDTWTPDEPERDPSIQPPPGRQQPVRGFGKVWREQPGVRDRLGWALRPEEAHTSSVQGFEQGIAIGIGSSVYVLTRTAGEPATWRKR